MASKSSSSETSRPAPAATTSAPAASPAVAQRAGNSAATERAGLGVGDASNYLGSSAGEVAEWLWGEAMDALGFGADESEDALALAKQTAGNLHSAHEKLDDLASAAKLAGLDDVAARLAGAASKLAEPAGLAEELGDAFETAEHIALLERVCDTTVAMIAVDMRSPEAAGVFDAWFAAVGEAGGVLAEKGGPWGSVLAPFASFIQMLGEMSFFANTKANMQMHGARGANGALLDELGREGL